MHLLIATTNPGKIREFREMLRDDSRITFDDLSRHPNLPPVAETGRTFIANACIKAAAYAKLLNTHALADDSGLVVDALDGKPGVHSARWAELHHAGQGNAANNALLLQQMADVPEEKRTARFVAVLALADPQGRILLTTRGEVQGRILTEPRGAGGFGYDPLFLVAGQNQTTGELPPEKKHQISHRGQALRRMNALLEIVEREAWSVER